MRSRRKPVESRQGRKVGDSLAAKQKASVEGFGGGSERVQIAIADTRGSVGTVRFEFDRVAFELFLAALQLSLSVTISVTTLRNARRRIAEASRAAERDLEDAIYLACAVDGNAHLLTTEDSDLRLLGSTYEGVRIVSWGDFRDELANRGLDVGWG